ncbi:MAG TPA: HAD-IIA family hydrolase [Spirochaetia bacterium]|nr:HAD-IIA family hydrolase [Spirochaetia bacterium]
MKNVASITRLAQLSPRVAGMILDMDGVLWAGDTPLIDMPWAFRRIREMGIRVVLISNNSSQTVGQLVEKVRSFGVEVETGQVINAAVAVVDILRRRFPEGSPVYVFGEDGLRATLRDHGYPHTDKGAPAVVVGLNRGAVYADLRDAATLIRRGALFVGTSRDHASPETDGEIIPGGGAFVAFFETATRRKATIAGKPSAYLFQLALQRLGTSATQTLVVGDRLDSDVAGGQAVGCRTALVLSGVSSVEDLEGFTPPPDLVASDLGAMLEA